MVIHFCGAGAEPLGGRPVRLSGTAVTSAVSDSDGDMLVRVTPAAAGSFAAEVTAP